MSDELNSNNELVAAFEAMWGKYPEPVRLIDRKFNIVAVNEAYKTLGGNAGVKCSAYGTPELHRGCKAMEALKTNETQVIVSEKNDVKWTTFWIPVSGHSDYFIHYTDGMNNYLKTLNKTTI